MYLCTLLIKSIHMKTFILLFIFSICLISCQKNDDVITTLSAPLDEITPLDTVVKVRNYFIEEYTHDIDGVVFKITNDIDSLINNRTKLIQKIDSLSFKKFQFPFSTDSVNNRSTYTWMKKGDYVCWRYKYVYDGQIPKINPNDDRYFVSIIINNPSSSDTYCTYDKLFYFNQVDVDKVRYQNIFPYPVNDTVYVNISSIFKEHFEKYIN